MVDPHCYKLTFNPLRVAAEFNRQITNGGGLTTEVWDAREMSPISSSGSGAGQQSFFIGSVSISGRES